MSKTKDAEVFGPEAYVYCDQHLNPHSTGWCTVGVEHKTKLDATDIVSAFEECVARGFKLYKGN